MTKSDPLFIPRSSLVSRAVRYTAWGLSGRTLAILLLLLVLGSLVGSFYLNQASHTTAAGLELIRLTEEREHWRQENAELRRQLAVAGSLQTVRARAAELGLVKPEAVEYLVVSSPAIEPSDQIGPPEPETSLDPTIVSADPQSGGWWDGLVTQLQSWADIRRSRP